MLIIVMFIIVVTETNQLTKIYLNQNRRIIKYCRFQFLALSLNFRWIKWWKVRVSMYVKVLHLPIIILYWRFFPNELLNLYFTTIIKRDSVKNSLKHILQAYLKCLRRFGKVSQKILRHQIESVFGFILLVNLSTNYPLPIRNFYY